MTTHGESEEPWSQARLERYIGTAESATIEFKRCDALRPSENKSRSDRLDECAIDIAAMANEQGGVIIYGLVEEKKDTRLIVTRVDEGFAAEDKVDRQWLLQVMRERIQPALVGLDAADVPLSNGRAALVVVVPQSRSMARQTPDRLFWRRDAQGRRKMSVQELEDLRNRSVLPKLELRLAVTRQSGDEFSAQFRVVNISEITASFAVITLGCFLQSSSATFASANEWHRVEVNDRWAVYRMVLSMGSSPRWSPITPGFQIAAQDFTLKITPRDQDIFSWAWKALVRLDYEGGAVLHRLEYKVRENPLRLTVGRPTDIELEWIEVPEVLYVRPETGDLASAAQQ